MLLRATYGDWDLNCFHTVYLGARGAVIIIRNWQADLSSNPGPDCSHFS